MKLRRRNSKPTNVGNNRIMRSKSKKILRMRTLSSTTLIFPNDFNQPLRPRDIRAGTERIKFGPVFNQPLKKGLIPNSVTYIEFGDGYDQELPEGSLPKSVRELVLGGTDLSKYSNALKSLNNLTHLHLPRQYDNTISSFKFPSSLIKLTFGDNFNQPIPEKTLPENLCDIVFGNNFNQPIPEKTLPENLCDIVFGNNFNQPVVIQYGVEKVTFGENFRQILDSSNVCETVSQIYLHSEYDMSLDDVPDNVKILKVGDRYIRSPVTIEIIVAEELLENSIPPEATKVSFKPSNDIKEIQSGLIPEGVREIEFMGLYPFPFREGVLPNSLRHLKIQTLHPESVYPPSINRLSIGLLTPEVPIPRLPKLTHIDIKICRINPEQDEIIIKPELIPDTVQKLYLNNKNFMYILPGSLPNGLTHLSIGSARKTGHNKLTLSNDKFINDKLPSSITHLELGEDVDLKIPPEVFPNLKHLVINNPNFSNKIPPVKYLKTNCQRIPPSVTHLETYKLDITKLKLPKSLVKLVYRRPPWPASTITKKNLPDTLRYLDITGYQSGIPNNVLPDNLKVLIMRCYEESPDIPKSVEILFVWAYNPSASIQIPNSVKELYLMGYFNVPVDDEMLPNNLTKLVLGERFNRRVSLPDTLRQLYIGNESYTDVILSQNIEELYIVPINLNNTYNTSPFPLEPIAVPVDISITHDVREVRIKTLMQSNMDILSDRVRQIILSPKLRLSPENIVPASVLVVYPPFPRTKIEQRTQPQCKKVNFRNEKRQPEVVDVCERTLEPATSNSDVFKDILNSLLTVCNGMELPPENEYIIKVKEEIEKYNIEEIDEDASGVISTTYSTEFISAISNKNILSKGLHNIIVNYTDTHAIDAGGVGRSYLTNLMESMKNNLFSPLKESSERYYISDHSDKKILGSIGHFSLHFDGLYEYKYSDTYSVSNVPYVLQNGILTATIEKHGLETGDVANIKSVKVNKDDMVLNVVDENTINMKVKIRSNISGNDLRIVVKERPYIYVSSPMVSKIPPKTKEIYMQVKSGAAISNIYPIHAMKDNTLLIKLPNRVDRILKGSCIIGIVKKETREINIRNIYYTAGILFSISIRNGINTSVPISRYLLRKMLHEEVSDKELMLCYLLDMSEKINDLRVLGGYQQYDTEYLVDEVKYLDDAFSEYIDTNPSASDEDIRKSAFSVLEKNVIDNAMVAYETPRLSSFIDGFRRTTSNIIDRFYLSPSELYELVYQRDISEEKMREILNNFTMSDGDDYLTDTQKKHLIDNILIPMGQEYYTKLLIFMSGKSTITSDESYNIFISENNRAIKGETCFNNLYLPSAFLDKTQDTETLIQILKNTIDDMGFNAA